MRLTDHLPVRRIGCRAWSTRIPTAAERDTSRGSCRGLSIDLSIVGLLRTLRNGAQAPHIHIRVRVTAIVLERLDTLQVLIGKGSSKARRRASLSQVSHPRRVDLSRDHALSDKVIIGKGDSSI